MKIWKFLATLGAVAFVLGAGLSGCTGNDPSSFVNSAKAYVAKNDYRSAIIELKNALQKDPDSGEARLLLARSLLETGDPVGAEVEVRKAIALHVPDDQTYPVLAWVLVSKGDFKKLTDEVGAHKIDDPRAHADVQSALAAAALAQGDLKQAKELADAALRDNPKSVRTLIVEAEIGARNNDVKEARQYIDAALQTAPSNLGVLLMKFNLEVAEGKL